MRDILYCLVFYLLIFPTSVYTSASTTEEELLVNLHSTDQSVSVQALQELAVIWSTGPDESSTSQLANCSYLFKVQSYTSTLMCLNSGLKTYPEFGALYYWKGSLMLALFNHETALKHFSENLQINPNNVFSIHKSASTYEKMGENHLAIELFRRYLEINPNNKKVQSQLLILEKKYNLETIFSHPFYSLDSDGK